MKLHEKLQNDVFDAVVSAGATDPRRHGGDIDEATRLLKQVVRNRLVKSLERFIAPVIRLRCHDLVQEDVGDERELFGETRYSDNDPIVRKRLDQVANERCRELAALAVDAMFNQGRTTAEVRAMCEVFDD